MNESMNKSVSLSFGEMVMAMNNCEWNPMDPYNFHSKLMRYHERQKSVASSRHDFMKMHVFLNPDGDMLDVHDAHNSVIGKDHHIHLYVTANSECIRDDTLFNFVMHMSTVTMKKICIHTIRPKFRITDDHYANYLFRLMMHTLDNMNMVRIIEEHMPMVTRYRYFPSRCGYTYEMLEVGWKKDGTRTYPYSDDIKVQ